MPSKSTSMRTKVEQWLAPVKSLQPAQHAARTLQFAQKRWGAIWTRPRDHTSQMGDPFGVQVGSRRPLNPRRPVRFPLAESYRRGGEECNTTV